MKLVVLSRHHSHPDSRQGEYSVLCELVNHTDEESYISRPVRITVTREQWDKLVPDAWLEVSEDVQLAERKDD